AREISSHLADCAACRALAESLPEDTLLSLLRKRSEPSAEMDSVCCTNAPPKVIPDAGAARTRSGESCVTSLDLELPRELADHPRYHILERLGSGGMGAVYKAEHRLMERPVALKIINPALMSRPALVERFRREVKAVARFSHPNIVTAYDADQAGDVHFLVMEFVEGISLAQEVEQHGR